MTENYIEFLNLITRSRLVEGYGSKVETSLIITLISNLVEEFDGKPIKDKVTLDKLTSVFKKYSLNLKIDEVETICKAINAPHGKMPTFTEDLLEQLHSGLFAFFSEENKKNYKTFSLGLLGSIVLLCLAYFSVDRLMHPRVTKVTYFNNKNLEGTPSSIDYEPLLTVKDFGMNAPKKGMPSDNFSIRYETVVSVKEDTPITLNVVSDDGVRVFIDDKVVMDYWVPQDGVQHNQALQLSAGKHRVKIEYFEALVGAKLSFNMLSAVPNNLSYEAPE